MKKTFSLLLTIISLFVLVPTVFGEAAQTERWVCLKPVAAQSGMGDSAFRQTLLTEADAKPLPSAETYVIECVATDQGQICTSGKTATDQVVYKKNNLGELQANIGYTYVGLFKADGVTAEANPVMSDAAGDLGSIEWESRSAHFQRKFLAMNYWTPNDVVTGTVGGQQQGTFDFEQADKKCVMISWDPYGRVFDSQTLEPVSGARVTLLVEKNGTYVQMTTADILGGNLINPQITKEDGQFSFVVPDGNYKLTTAPAPVTKVASVNTHYTKAYSELYPVLSGEVIEQRGAMQHRDIPAASSNTVRPVKMMAYFYEALPSGKLSVEGTVSHPLTTLIAKSVKVSSTNPNVKTPYRTIATVQADKWGKFSLEIDQSTLEKTEEYVEIFSEVEMVKTDLKVAVKNNSVLEKIASLLKSIIPSVFAQAAGTTLHFEPIPQYLEGFAYGAAGQVLSNATVEVYETMSNKAYSKTKTDATGYFKISSEYLPRYTYELKFVAADGSVTKKTTSQFISANQKTIAEKKIDLYAYRDTQNRTIEDIVKLSPTVAKQGGDPALKNETGTKGGHDNSVTEVVASVVGDNWWIILSIVVLVIILVTIVIVVRKKQLPPQGGEAMIQ